MNAFRCGWVLTLVLFGGLALPAAAHKPVAVGQLESSAADPIALFDIEVSQVLYYEPTAPRPEVWTRFSGAAGQELYVQLGVPRIAGLESVRPAFVLLWRDEEAEEVSLPVTVPDGFTGVEYTTAGKEANAFDEPFTGTKDWQFPAERIALPVSGEYLLAAYVPGGGLEKFWIAVGEEEAFTAADIVGLPGITVQVRLFHEVFPIGGIALLAPLLALVAGVLALLAWLG